MSMIGVLRVSGLCAALSACGATDGRVKSGIVTVGAVHSGEQFLIATFSDGPSNCTNRQEGPCEISLCNETGAPRKVSAGTVTFTSPDLAGSATAVPDAANDYGIGTFDFATRLAGGERGLLSASGGEVPPFQIDLDVPLVLLLSLPEAATNIVSVPSDRDLVLAWTRDAPGIEFYAFASELRPDGKPGSSNVVCHVASSADALTIPASVMSLLPSQTLVRLYTVNLKEITVGDYALSLSVISNVATPDKTLLPNLIIE